MLSSIRVSQKLSSLRTDPHVCETGYCPGAFKKCCFQFYYFERFIECHWTRGLWKGLITKKASGLSKPFPGIRKLKMVRIQEKSTHECTYQHQPSFIRLKVVSTEHLTDICAKLSHIFGLWKFNFNIFTLFLMMLGLFRSSSTNFRLVLKFYGISSYQKLLYLNTRVCFSSDAGKGDWGEKRVWNLILLRPENSSHKVEVWETSHFARGVQCITPLGSTETGDGVLELRT